MAKSGNWSPEGLELCCTLSASPEMIDYNGHVNIGYYAILFEAAARAILPRYDLSSAYRERTGRALFAVEAHTVFRKEVFQDEALAMYLRLVDASDRALHAMYAMVKQSSAELAAVQEVLYLHVDLESRRTVAIEPGTRVLLATLKAKQEPYAPPVEPGRHISIRRRP
jgi:acyl-CoA thioester hydrolase